jgi:hypothetical protein
VGVRIVPAVEISARSTTAQPRPPELHILGYNIDHTGPALGRRAQSLRQERTAEAGRRPAEGRGPADQPPHLAGAELRAPANAPA